jgi:hypothetical protein
MCACPHRLARALAVSGRRLFEAQDAAGWPVLAGGDRRRRPVLRAAAALALRLIEEGALRAAPGGGFVWAGEAAPAHERPAQPIAADAPAARRAGLAGFAYLSAQAARGAGPLTLREAEAGRRLIRDAELRLRLPGLSMNWDAAPSDGHARSGAPLRSAASAAAARRLERVEARAGRAAFALALAACVGGLPLSRLEARFALAPRSAGRRLSDALEKVAAAYDG